MKKLTLCFTFIITCLIVQNLLAQPTLNAVRVDRNVVFGMYSGLALLMDVYYPENPNGYGIIQISGSGWSKPLSYDSKMLNHQRHVKLEGEMFVEAGYTLFSVNHRATPRFVYPAAVEDVQRAVRFIRYHADKFGINPDRIGAIGGSSGGHLVSLLGVLDGNEIPADDTPINRMSAKLQCVIARAAPTDFLYSSNGVYFSNSSNGQYFLNVKVKNKPFTIEYKIAQMASPIYHISVDDPPFLLIHGDQDPIVPYVLSENMHNKLLEMNIVSNLITVEGGFHGPGVIDSPEVREKMVQWMDMYLIEK
jgi:acetyl esterase/lipase